MEYIPLCDIKKGEQLIIKKMLKNETLGRRLLDMGFIEGTKVECVRVSPFGDPKAYHIRGAIIALRKEDAKTILGVKIP